MYGPWRWTPVRNSGWILPFPFKYQLWCAASSERNMTKALKIFQTEYLWWVLTDHWDKSVCIFHCKLCGETRETELLNTRDGGSLWRFSLDDFDDDLPKHHELVPNITEYVLKHYKNDLEYYHEKVIPISHFRFLDKNNLMHNNFKIIFSG